MAAEFCHVSVYSLGNSVTVSWPGQGHGLLAAQRVALGPLPSFVPVGPIGTDYSRTGLNPLLLVGEILGDLGSINYVKCPSRLGAQLR